MLALISVWLPLAYRDNKQATPKQLHQVIRDCTHRLMMQLQYFREMDEMAGQQNQLDSCTSNGKLIKPSESSLPAVEDETQYDPDDLFNN